MFRYIGNKTKLLSYIADRIDDITGGKGVVADIMAGTGSVSVELRKRGHTLISSDIMTYSKVHLISQLLISEPPLFKNNDEIEDSENKYARILDYLNNLQPVDGYFFNEFSPLGTPKNGCTSRKYFTSDNARKIDAIRGEINKWSAENSINEIEEALLKHTLILAVNRVANISGTYGYFLSKFSKSSLEDIILKPFEFINDSNTQHTVLQGEAEVLACTIKADICYIDPPYTKRQYAANYHILETIARGDFPEAVGKSGLRNWWDQHSKFCTKPNALNLLEKIIQEMDCENFLISYSEDGLIKIDELRNMLNKYGIVSTDEIKYNRFKSNRSSLDKQLKEYLIHLRRT